MRKKTAAICEVCGGTRLSVSQEYLVFHCLTFCSPDCLDDYRAADEERRVNREKSRADKPVRAGRSRAA
jgi:hypothetical protein